MDKFEDTVVNPNISLKNFEVRIREPEKNQQNRREVVTTATPKAHSKKRTKSIYILALLTSIFIYQVIATINF